MKKVIYISIPISGKDEKVQRAKAYAVYDMLSAQGYTPINPFDVGDDLDKTHKFKEKQKPTYTEYMRSDLKHLIGIAEAIYMCEGWEDSNGCDTEHRIAISTGMEIIYQ